MGQAKVTLIGLENFLNMNDMSIFDFMKLPEKIDKVALENSILMDLGEYEPLWGDPLFFRNMVGVWSEKWARTFLKWSEVLDIDYNPLENYDRQEEWTEKEKATNTLIGTITGNTIDNGTNQQDVSAYNDTGFEPSNKNTINTSTDSTSTSNSTNSDTRSNKRTSRAHGNIGVTTSQQMLQSELDIARFSIYQSITDIFAQEFCLLVDD